MGSFFTLFKNQPFMKPLKRFVRSVMFSISPSYFSFSQAGEDAILRFLFDDKKLTRITYLDIGTNIPDSGNNTYLFYEKGSSGVCVEADGTLIPDIQAVRPKDTILNIGVSVGEDKESLFYVFNPNGMSTFDKEEAKKREQSGQYRIVKTVKVPLVNINQLIGQNFKTYPDLLSLDIEGLDLRVLKSLNFVEYPIPVICVETCMFSDNHIRPKDHSIAEFRI
jgi:FkbM family methyltransferase